MLGIAAAEEGVWGPYTITGLYTDADCKNQIAQSTGFWFGDLKNTVHLDSCIPNVLGLPSVFTCEEPGVIREVNYKDDKCATAPTLNFTFRQNSCNMYADKGVYFLAKWHVGCSTEDPAAAQQETTTFMAMALEKKATLVVAGSAAASGASFTCPSKMQGASPGFTCTMTMTCLSAGQARSTTTCAFQGTNMDPHSNDQPTNGIPCDQYLGMVKPMMCANNEFIATALEDFKEPGQAWTNTLLVAGSAGASGALVMFALLRSRRFTVREPVLLG